MRTPAKYIENLDKGIVTEQMLCDVLYSYNKRAKNWRDKKRTYKNSFSTNSLTWFKDARENEQKYYGYKTELLNLLEPDCIHEEVIESEYDTVIQYYLLYVIGDHSFHHPIHKADIEKYPDLNVVRIEQLVTRGTSGDR